MSHLVKRCDNCGTENDPDEVLCRKCQVMLPLKAIQNDTRPPAQQPEQVKTKPPSTPPTPAKTTKPETREWPYQAVPVVVQKTPLRVVITGLDIGFFDLVLLLTELMLAALPALILATVILVLIFAALGSLFGLPGR